MRVKRRKEGYIDVFKNKQYIKTIISSIINRLGDSIDSIAFTWLVYQVTQSAAWSAIIFGLNRIPTIFLQPIAGAVIEHKNKRLTMVITDLIRGVCVGFVATAYLFGFVNQWILLTCTIIISCAEAFNRPAATALVPKLLDKKEYNFGLSLNSIASSVAELAGYGVAGIIITTFSISVAIYIDMVTFFLSAIIIFTVKVIEEKYNTTIVKNTDYITNIKSGFTYLRSNVLLRYFMIFAVFMNGVLVPFNSLQAPLIKEVLNTNEIMLSVLSLAITFGMIFGAALYPYIAKLINSRMIACMAGYSIGIYYLTFALVGNFITVAIWKYIIIAVATFIVGLMISLGSSFINIAFMKHIEEGYIARGVAIMGAVCMAAIPLISFIVSALSRWFPTIAIFILSGILDILICMKLCGKKQFLAIQFYEKENNKENNAMMKKVEIENHINLLDEAYRLLYYWVNNDNEIEELKYKYKDNYEADLERYNNRFETIIKMYHDITEHLQEEKEKITYYFKERANMSTLGSLAILLNYHNHDNKLQEYEERMKNITEEEKIWLYTMLINCDEAINIPKNNLSTLSDLINFIETSPYESDAKWEVMKIFNNQETYYNEVHQILSKVINIFHDTFSDEIKQIGQEFYEYWNNYQNSSDIVELIGEKLNVSWNYNEVGTVLLPQIFNPVGVSVSIDESDKSTKDVIRFGIILDERIAITRNNMKKDDLISFGKLLSDKSKVDIMEYISKKPSYGKEIANVLNLSTATISYHMNALTKLGFICEEVSSNKIYYSINKDKIASHLDEMKKFFFEL